MDFTLVGLLNVGSVNEYSSRPKPLLSEVLRPQLVSTLLSLFYFSDT